MERILKQIAVNRLSIMFRLPVYSQERLDLVDKLERSGYGVVREPNPNMMHEVLAGLAAVAAIAVFVLGMVIVSI